MEGLNLQNYISFLKESDEIENISLPEGDYEKALTAFMPTTEENAENGEFLTNYCSDHVYALSYVLKNRDKVPTLFDILEIHRRLMRNSGLPENAIGSFRRVEVMVGNHVPPAPVAVPYYMEGFCERLKYGFNPKTAHFHFEWIHPFVDGNGRVGRLLWVWLKLNSGSSFGSFLKTTYNETSFSLARSRYYDELSEWKPTL